jgi:hypothetical protein
MKRVLKACFVVAINLIVLAVLMGGVELYYRVRHPGTVTEFAAHNGLWQRFQPYVMTTSAPGPYTEWANTFTGERFAANVVTNSLGFNDRHEFAFSKPYNKAANERVVLFIGGSAGWGVGATANETTVAGRMQHHLNALQSERRYTVINLAMGSWIGFQEFMALELWGDVFQPDWIVVMDGFNDASVG